MNELERELLEQHLTAIAGGLVYPRTPDVAGKVSGRLPGATRWRFAPKAAAWSLTFGLVLCASLMLIPPARAAILDFIQIGIVRIFPRSATVTPPPTALPAIQLPVTATSTALTPVPTAALLPILEQIAGQTSLEQARQQVPYVIRLPAYPADLGEPDVVYVQRAEGLMTVLVWLDSALPDVIRMSLHVIPATSWQIQKFQPQALEVTQVNGQRALWTIGPYPLQLKNQDYEYTRLIQGHVLIWTEGDLTYRLETDLSLEEAVRVAESLQPAP